jgi:uncharacterized protein (TIGR02453 family)
MSPDIAPFSGFPAATTDFLRGLANDNTKAWFDAHRKEYESFYVAPALSFIATIGPRLQAEVDAGLQYEPRINGSLFRIQRDIRFSRDKTPYKPHIDMWFWHGDRKSWQTTGFFFRLAPDSLILGAGMHQFGPEAIKRFRDAVLDPAQGSALTEVVEEIESAPGFAVGGESRKTVPRGFDPQHERARFLRHEGLHAEHETSVPPEAASAALIDYCIERFKTVSPLNRWLRDAMRA